MNRNNREMLILKARIQIKINEIQEEINTITEYGHELDELDNLRKQYLSIMYIKRATLNDILEDIMEVCCE